MAEFSSGVDFNAFKKDQIVDIEGKFETVSPLAIILDDCRFASKHVEPKKG